MADEWCTCSMCGNTFTSNIITTMCDKCLEKCNTANEYPKCPKCGRKNNSKNKYCGKCVYDVFGGNSR